MLTLINLCPSLGSFCIFSTVFLKRSHRVPGLQPAVRLVTAQTNPDPPSRIIHCIQILLMDSPVFDCRAQYNVILAMRDHDGPTFAVKSFGKYEIL